MRRTDDDAGASSSRQSSSKSFFNVVSLSKVEHTREFLRRVGALNNAETKVDVDNGVVLYLQFFFFVCVFWMIFSGLCVLSHQFFRGVLKDDFKWRSTDKKKRR